MNKNRIKVCAKWHTEHGGHCSNICITKYTKADAEITYKLYHTMREKLRIKVSFKWFDMWVGAYIDTRERAIYICIIPMIVLKIWRGVLPCK